MPPEKRLHELTGREQEVLALIRAGLTNEEIAVRLGITLAGAKYHVSQILSKLGVATREEAAALAPEPRRRWWVALPLAAKAAGAALVVAALAGLGVLAWGVWETSGEGDPSPDLQDVTVDEIYSRALKSASGVDSILHTTVTYPETTLQNGEKLTPTTEMWIDGEADAARRHIIGTAEGEADERDDLIVGEHIYYFNQPINPGQQMSANRDKFDTRCPGVDRAVIALLFACFGGSQTATRVEVDEFEGRAVAALVTAGTYGSGSEAVEFETTVYLDPETWLPIASVIEGFPLYESGGQVITRYDHQILDRAEVAANFFDPHSVGYGLANAGDLLDALEERTPVYWLGGEHEFGSGVCKVPHAGTCTLVLTDVESNPPDGSVGRLTYGEDTCCVSIGLWRSGYLDELPNTPEGRALENPRCASRSELQLESARAVIYVLTPVTYPLVTPPPEDPCSARYAGPPPVVADRDGPEIYDGAIAFVDFGDVVVEVNGPQPGVYVTRQAVEAVVKALQPR